VAMISRSYGVISKPFKINKDYLSLTVTISHGYYCPSFWDLCWQVWSLGGHLTALERLDTMEEMASKILV